MANTPPLAGKMEGSMDGAKHLQPEELMSHLAWMRGLARALVRDGDGDAADDLAQEGVEAALVAPPLADRPVRPWLAGVLRNLALMRRRARARRQARETAAADLREPPRSPEALALEVATQRQVAAHVLALEESLRTTVLLRYYEGRSSAEIARLQGIPAGTVRRRLKTGLDQIRAALDREHQGDGRRWRALLAPVALRPPAGDLGGPSATAPAASQTALVNLIAGAVVMNSKVKIGAVAALLVAILLTLRGVGWWPGGSPGAARPGTAEVGAPRAGVRLASRAGGMQVSVASTAEPDGVLRLVGQVIDEQEAPLEGALVAIDSSPPRTATSDVNGRFSFTALRPRPYHLEAHAGQLFAGPVVARASASGEPVVLRARAAATVEVAVRSARQGAAVPGAEIELRSTLVWRARTDSGGQARLTGVGAGWHPLRVEAPGFAPAAQMLIAESGAVVQRVTVRLEPGVPVSGRVVNQAGAAIAGARVWARSSSEPFPVVDPAVDAVTSDAEGRFRLEALAAGSYQLAASHPEHAPGATPPVAVGATAVSGVELRLEAGGRLTGEVREVDGRPVAGAEVRAGALSRTLPWSDSRDAFTDAQGRFELTGLPRRSLQVLAVAEHAASAMTTVDLSAAPQARVTLTLDVRKEIAGTVVDSQGQPVGEAQVTARPAGPGAPGPDAWDLRGYPSLVSDAGGRFRFTGLPEGQYQLRAARPGSAPHVARNQAATAARAGDQGVKVLVRAEGTVVGRALFDDGTAAPPFSVSLGAAKAGPFSAPDGAFAVSSPAGRHDLTISGESFLSARLERIELGEGQRKDVGVVRIKRGRAITGVVVMPDGTPVPGAEVVAARQLTGSGTRLYIPTESHDARDTTSGEDGRFTLSGFEDRTLVVVADAEGRGRSVATPIAPGPASVDVKLVLEPTGSLEGRITREGVPFPDTVVTATPELGLANYFVTSGPDGRYALDTLTAGPYYLVAFSGRNKDQMLVPATVTPGKRTRADLDVRSGALAMTVTVQTEERQPVLAAHLLIASGSFPIPDGTPMESARAQLRPTEPTSILFRVARGPTRIDGLRAGPHTVCAVAARLPPNDPQAADRARPNMADPMRCLQRDLSGNAELVVTVPKAWTLPKEPATAAVTPPRGEARP